MVKNWRSVSGIMKQEAQGKIFAILPLLTTILLALLLARIFEYQKEQPRQLL
jgi:hypothetical protein